MKTTELLRSIKRALELPPEAMDWSGIVEAIDVELAKPEGEWQPTIESVCADLIVTFECAFRAGLTAAAAICRDYKLFPHGGAGEDYAQAIERSRDGDQP